MSLFNREIKSPSPSLVSPYESTSPPPTLPSSPDANQEKVGSLGSHILKRPLEGLSQIEGSRKFSKVETGSSIGDTDQPESEINQTEQGEQAEEKALQPNFFPNYLAAWTSLDQLPNPLIEMTPERWHSSTDLERVTEVVNLLKSADPLEPTIIELVDRLWNFIDQLPTDSEILLASEVALGLPATPRTVAKRAMTTLSFKEKDHQINGVMRDLLIRDSCYFKNLFTSSFKESSLKIFLLKNYSDETFSQLIKAQYEDGPVDQAVVDLGRELELCPAEILEAAIPNLGYPLVADEELDFDQQHLLLMLLPGFSKASNSSSVKSKVAASLALTWQTMQSSSLRSKFFKSIKSLNIKELDLIKSLSEEELFLLLDACPQIQTIKGHIPLGLFKHPGLMARLALRHIHPSHAVDFDFIENVKKFTQLESAKLTFKTPDPIFGDQSLESILSGLFTACNKLTYLDLSSDLLDPDLFSLSRFYFLKTLKLNSQAAAISLEVVQALATHCPNLEVLELNGIVNLDGMERLFCNCEQLRRLRLEWRELDQAPKQPLLGQQEDPVSDQSLAPLYALAAMCHHLEELELINFHALLESHVFALFNNCPELRLVNFEKSTLNDAHFQGILKFPPRLESVNVSYTWATRKTIEALIHNCPLLKTLCYSCYIFEATRELMEEKGISYPLHLQTIDDSVDGYSDPDDYDNFEANLNPEDDLSPGDYLIPNYNPFPDGYFDPVDLNLDKVQVDGHAEDELEEKVTGLGKPVLDPVDQSKLIDFLNRGLLGFVPSDKLLKTLRKTANFCKDKKIQDAYLKFLETFEKSHTVCVSTQVKAGQVFENIESLTIIPNEMGPDDPYDNRVEIYYEIPNCLPEILQQYPNLKNLKIAGKEIYISPAREIECDKFSSLRKLKIKPENHCSVSFGFLKNFSDRAKKLEEFYYGAGGVEDDRESFLAFIGFLLNQKLRKFLLYHINPLLTFAIASLCPDLEKLALLKSELQDYHLKAIIKRNVKLKAINFHGSTVSNQAIQKLAEQCKELHTAILTGTDISEESLKALANHCPRLKKLHFSCFISSQTAELLIQQCKSFKEIVCDSMSAETFLKFTRQCAHLERIEADITGAYTAQKWGELITACGDRRVHIRMQGIEFKSLGYARILD